MRRLLYLAALSMLVMLVFAQVALAQEDIADIRAQAADIAPLNADGTCPEGYVTVNAPFCAQESPNTPGRIFGYGEGDLANPTTASAQYQQYAPATTALPVTGGPALLLPASVLLLGAGLIGMRLVRRS